MCASRCTWHLGPYWTTCAQCNKGGLYNATIVGMGFQVGESMWLDQGICVAAMVCACVTGQVYTSVICGCSLDQQEQPDAHLQAL
jgi:hypothetical protein